MARRSGVVKEATEKIVKKIPASDNGPGVSCTTKGGSHYQISQNVEKNEVHLMESHRE